MLLAKIGLRFGVRALIRRYASGEEYAGYLKGEGYAIGEHCSVHPSTLLPIPELIRIGDNVRFSHGVALLTYEGSMAMLSRAYGRSLDRVGPIVIRDNVFIGRGATVKYGVTLGPNVVVGAGAVVTRSFSNAVVVGAPAREVMSCDEFVAKVGRDMKRYPWAGLIERRQGGFDPKIEPILNAARAQYFFPEDHIAPEADSEPGLIPAFGFRPAFVG